MLYNGFQPATPRLGSRNFVVSKDIIKLDLKPGNKASKQYLL